MTGPFEDDPEDLSLLDVERDLTKEEEGRLLALARTAWRDIEVSLLARAKAAYGVASPPNFRQCVLEHMNDTARRLMAQAEVYHCPACGRLLKDRGTAVASSILLERRRIRALWQAVEDAQTDEEREAAMRRFTAALGKE